MCKNLDGENSANFGQLSNFSGAKVFLHTSIWYLLAMKYTHMSFYCISLVHVYVVINVKTKYHHSLTSCSFYRSSVLLKTEAPPPLVQEISDSSLTVKVRVCVCVYMCICVLVHWLMSSCSKKLKILIILLQ